MLTIQIILFILFVLVNAADLYTTKRAVLDNSTRFHEANPIMAFIMKHFGFWLGLGGIKILACAGVGYGLFVFPGVATCISTVLVTAFIGYVAYHNKKLLGKR